MSQAKIYSIIYSAVWCGVEKQLNIF